MKKHEENFYREILKDKNNPQYETVNKIVKSSQKFWELYDFLFKDNKSSVFEMLILNPNSKDYTYIKMSYLLNISLSSLLRHRRMIYIILDYLYENSENAGALEEAAFTLSE